jgi:Domain of unknown function (DUF4936)
LIVTVSALQNVPGLALFVYYRVPAPKLATALTSILAMQSEMRRSHVGLIARLMRQANAPVEGRDETWMEVYEHPCGVGSACMARLSELAAALPAGLIGARHIESFSPLVAGSAGKA